ncbi:uncharacterized protein LOC123969648 [Micropterus dolomieu]|uniref:uncharacterized protein LOC123969648 n=1 Tax=Micropterus dolomieu TaxID=147949 RepID=UPI001E8EA57E|nr:uncharacterized protein LOC123969648 [Micropterus dolomieu]
MFHVVEFLETHEVELVPSLWVTDGQCCWPSALRGMTLHQAIKTGIAPDITWDRWEVRIMYSTVCYEEGRKKAKEAETLSDLQSDTEVSCKRPLRRKTEVLTKLEMVLDQQNTILQLLQHHKTALPAVDIEEGLLPLQDLPHLLNIEQRLQQTADFKIQMVNYLGLIGGTDVRDCTWRVLRQLFANNLAKQLNWRAVNGKMSLASLQLKDVVIDAVWRNPFTSSAAEKEVEGTMKRWLQLAADREGGRKRRLLSKENV